jgi:hypothetical protein
LHLIFQRTVDGVSRCGKRSRPCPAALCGFESVGRECARRRLCIGYCP